MQATPDDGLWKVWKRTGEFWSIHPRIPTWNQNTCQEINVSNNNYIDRMWFYYF